MSTLGNTSPCYDDDHDEYQDENNFDDYGDDFDDLASLSAMSSCQHLSGADLQTWGW